ncbi:hypothetical protein Atai01_09510 [Amycolatopsis taiwanensis]|uniref:Transposase n=1 Tax=Amycolatopsis taiwanensis TaxID=342230 RepID=A0A9W6QYH4_9PSEU|nr:hypothetical protein Atai01_09510 [Amycolatopsis taiwanensis]
MKAVCAQVADREVQVDLRRYPDRDRRRYDGKHVSKPTLPLGTDLREEKQAPLGDISSQPVTPTSAHSYDK